MGVDQRRCSFKIGFEEAARRIGEFGGGGPFKLFDVSEGGEHVSFPGRCCGGGAGSSNN